MQNPAASAFQRHYAQIVRYLRRRTRSDEDAEDLAQAVFADAAAQLDALGPGSPPALAWYTPLVLSRRSIGGKRLFVEIRAGKIHRHNLQGLAFVS